MVLGELLGGNQPVRPSPGQRIAVRQQQNIRPLNVHTDSDDIVRRLPLSFTINGAKVPSMAVELASRALGAAPEFDERGRLTLAGYRVPGRVPNTMTLNFEGGADDIPTFSFADLRACAVKNDKDYFRRWFDGKVVIFGTVLDIEDRRMTSKRFATGIEGARIPRCAAESTPVTAGSQDQHDRGRLYPRDRGQQPDRAQRGGRTRPAAALPDLGPVCGAGRGRRLAVRTAQRGTGLDWP